MNDKIKSPVVWEQLQFHVLSASNSARDLADVGHVSILKAPERVMIFLCGATGDG